MVLFRCECAVLVSFGARSCLANPRVEVQASIYDVTPSNSAARVRMSLVIVTFFRRFFFV